MAARQHGFQIISAKPVMRFPSYASAIWKKHNWNRRWFPLFRFIETTTVALKPKHAIYYSVIFHFIKPSVDL
jgi:hypothetical protein